MPSLTSRAEPHESQGTDTHRWIDLKTLMAIQDLQWRAKTVVDGFQTGLHRSPLHGFSVEFSEYRPFSMGDDPRNIDWKLYARSDRYYIKKFEDETNRRCYLVVDQSRSMNYGSVGYSKLDYARTLSATIAFQLIRQRDAVGLITFDAVVADLLTARYRTGQLKRILSMLERPTSGEATDLVSPLRQVSDLVRHRSLVTIVSDFLVSPEELQTPLAFLRARKHEVVLMRVLDPREIDFQHPNPVMVRDLESGQERFVDPTLVRESYRKRFEEHEARLKAIAEPLGIAVVQLPTDYPLELALHEFLSQRERGLTTRQAVGDRYGTGAHSGGTPGQGGSRG
ncbi:MAG: DUF58 domain-containing protein [Planctomycetota bacterium]